jgi:soluble lytic murein transglycosylase-like protein
MSASIAAQVTAVRQQAGAPTGAGFFVLPWATPALPPPDSGEECLPLSPSEVDSYVQEASRREGFTPDLLRAVIQQESGYQPCAVSSKGALGLMQLMPGTADDMGVVDVFDPRENISGGARYLGEMLMRYGGDLEKALAAYNAGPARVDKYQGLPPIPETMNYVADIMAALKEEPQQH